MSRTIDPNAFYATLDETGRPTHFYNFDLYGEAIPDEAIELTADQVASLQANANQILVEGALAPAPSSAADFAALKAALKAQVDARAEEIRLTLITPGSGQAMEYQEAYAQAQSALDATGAVKASDYPMLAATIGVDVDPDSEKPATDVLGVARSVKAAYEGFLQAGAAIRGARLLAKAEIDAAGDADHARAIFAAVKWPTFG